MNLNYLYDTEIFEVNTVEPHSNHKFYFGEESEFQEINLNGTWKFKYLKNIDEVDFVFSNVDQWDNIKVPAHIELSGYGEPKYVNVQYPWDGIEKLIPPSIPKEINRFGMYCRYVNLEEDFLQNETYIRFDGVESAMFLFVNDEFVGYSEDTFTPSEFDLTKFLRVGVNKISVLVAKFCTGSWLEDQDFWRFFGIFRDVKIYSIPKVHIYDLDIKPTLTNNHLDGVLNIKLKIKNFENLDFKIKMKLNEEIYNIEDTDFSCTIKNVSKWSAENPKLYPIEIIIFDEDDNIIEIIKEKIGFRTFELKNKLMLINGKPISFRGVNRHEFSCRTGRVISYEETLEDILIMKRNNINALRTSHYPNNTFVYELCDEYGIYVIDETNLETHGTWGVGLNPNPYILPHNKKEWEKAVLQRGKNMYERDKNHPSIIIFSCGNESFGGSVISELSKYFKNVDTTRLVHYEGIFNDRTFNETSDMESQMYTTPEKVEEYLNNNPEKPIILCEYSHAMGNSNGGLHKYLEVEEKYPMYQGGFIWDFVDQSLIVKNSDGVEYFTSGGDFYDRPNDGNFCGNGIVFADRKETPKMREVKHLYSPVKIEIFESTYKITNKNLFVGTDIYDFEYEIYENGELIHKRELDIKLFPLSKETYNLPAFDDDGDCEYTFVINCYMKNKTNWCEKGHQISFGQKVINEENIFERVKKVFVNDYILKTSFKNTFEIIETDFNIGVKICDVHYLFNKRNGELYSIKKNEKEYLKTSLRPNFWKATIDNDRANGRILEWAKWKTNSEYQILKHIKVEYTSIIAEYGFIDSEDICRICYSFCTDGSINVSVNLNCENKKLSLPNFGVIFKMDKSFENVSWYGNEALEASVDRCCSKKIVLTENKVIDNYINYLKPQDCGNKTDVRFIEIYNDEKQGLKISSHIPFEASVLPYTPFELENAKNSSELPNYTNTVITANMFKTGVGGNDSWGSKPYDEYTLKTSDKLEFCFNIEVIDN